MLVFHCLITKKKSPTTRLIKTRQAVFYTAPMKSEPGRERESYDGKPIYSGTGLQMVGMGYHFSCLNFSVSSCRSSATSHSDPTVVFSPVVNPIVTYTTGYRRHSHDKGRATILMNSVIRQGRHCNTSQNSMQDYIQASFCQGIFPPNFNCLQHVGQGYPGVQLHRRIHMYSFEACFSQLSNTIIKFVYNFIVLYKMSCFLPSVTPVSPGGLQMTLFAEETFDIHVHD